MTGIIFDMDGTLWDSSEEVALAWTEVAEKHPTAARSFTIEDLQALMGKTMDDIAEISFPNLETEERNALLEACCDNENDYLLRNGAKLTPNLEETLKELKKDYPLFIVSNCQSGYIEAFLSHYGFEDYFEDIECYGNNNLLKEDNIRLIAERNGLSDFYYVGDTILDYTSCKNAGGTFIHAAYGFGNVPEGTPYINDFSELPSILKTL